MKILIFFQEVIIHLVLRDRFNYPLQCVKTVRDKDLSTEEKKAASKLLQNRAKEIKKEITKILQPGNGRKGIAYELPDQSVSNIC